MFLNYNYCLFYQNKDHESYIGKVVMSMFKGKNASL